MNELELLKEIENIDKEIKTGELFTRCLNEKDWDTLVEWWDTWPDWTTPPRDFLPDNGTGGLMVEKDGLPIVAGFIYETNTKRFSKLCKRTGHFKGVFLGFKGTRPGYKFDFLIVGKG